MSWQREPPTYDEWLGAKNHGAWWIKFRLCEETTEPNEDGELITWPEAWLTDIVTITCSYPNGMADRRNVRLHASGSHGVRFDLDDEEKVKHLYWQAVKPPDDDGKDEKPLC